MTDRQFDKRLAALEKRVKLLETAATHSFEATRLLADSVVRWGDAVTGLAGIVARLDNKSANLPQQEPPGFSMN